MHPLSTMHAERGILILTGVLFWVLAICIPAVEFEPGKPFGASGSSPQGAPLSWGFFSIILAAAAAVLVKIGIDAVRKIRKKRKPGDDPHEWYREPIPTPWTVYAAVALLFSAIPAVVWLARQPSTPATSPAVEADTAAAEPIRPVPSSLAPQGRAGPSEGSSGRRLGTYLLILSLTGAAAWAAVHLVKKRLAWRSRTLSEMRLIHRDAADLGKGMDISDVVLRSYRDMCLILTRRVSYPGQMTPREFARRCAQAGAPAREVMRLTELFEAVRYGRHSAGPEAINESIRLLHSVARHAGEGIE